MNILITGAFGQLGSELRELSSTMNTNCNFIFTDVATLDITSKDQIDLFFYKNNISLILNCAAYTAVDKAETDLDNARMINTVAPSYLAEMAQKYSAKLIHISTDYVFNGTNSVPYKETDLTNPESAYGLTKLEGEKNVFKILENSLIIRTSWLYSSYGNNFVKTIMRLGKERDELRIIFDQIGTPTYARDLAFVIIKIIESTNENPDNFKGGIYHFSNEGVCSWYDFAIEILKLSEISCRVLPIETKDYPLPAKRPHYSVFNKEKIKAAYNIAIPYWKDSLKECIDKIVKSA